jgi:AcrR family transcriptional regulator
MPQKRKARQKPRSRDELRALIVAAATRLFSEKGFSEPTIRDIADSAGVALPSLYRLFIDKRDIYIICCKEAAARLREVFQAQDGTWNDPEALLYERILFSLQSLQNMPDDYRLLNRLLLDGDLDLISAEVETFVTSPYYLTGVEAAKMISGGDLPRLRLLFLQALFSQLPGLLKLWPGIECDLDDHHASARQILSIVFPTVDWSKLPETNRPG